MPQHVAVLSCLRRGLAWRVTEALRINSEESTHQRTHSRRQPTLSFSLPPSSFLHLLLLLLLFVPFPFLPPEDASETPTPVHGVGVSAF